MVAVFVKHRDTRRTSPFVVHRADERLLIALADYRYLTVVQTVRLFYSRGSKTLVQTRLKHLAAAGFLLKTFLPRGARSGSTATVYTLARRGRRYVEQQGIEVPDRVRPGEEFRREERFLRHALACVDVYSALQLACSHSKTLSLERFMHDRSLRRQAAGVRSTVQARRASPDGWLELHEQTTRGVYRHPLALEVDRGTERQAAWRRKIRGLLAWVSGPYHVLFATRAVTIAVIAVGDPRRAAVLRAWTEAELTALGREPAGAWFRFTGMNAAAVEPETFLLAPQWQEPYLAGMSTLLELEEDAR